MDSIIVIPYEVRRKIFSFLDSNSFKCVRLVCKEWMLQLEHDGLLNPIFDDRITNNIRFCYGITSPKFVTISHVGETDEDFLCWTNYLEHLRLRCPIEFDDFVYFSNYLTKLELSGRFFSENKLNWKSNKKIILPSLKVFIMKIFFPKVHRNIIGKSLTKDIKELIMLANIKIIFLALKTTNLEEFEFKTGISNCVTLLGEESENEESANLLDKLLDTKEFICRNLKHLKILKCDFMDRVSLDKFYLSPGSNLRELSYKLHDGQPYNLDNNDNENSTQPEYFWNQFMQNCRLYNLISLTFESFKVSVPLENLMNQLEYKIPRLEEFYFTGKLYTGSKVINVRGSPIEVRGALKNVDKVSCTIFEKMSRLKKIELRLLKQGGFVHLIHLESLPSSLEYISIKDTILLPQELDTLKNLKLLKDFTYSNSLRDSLKQKSNRIFCKHLEGFVKMGTLQKVEISPVFTEFPIETYGDGRNGQKIRKSILFWKKEQICASVLNKLGKIDKTMRKSGLNSYSFLL